MKKLILIIFCLFLFILFCAESNILYAKSVAKTKTSKKPSKDTQPKEGLDVLIEVSKSQKGMALELNQETESYKKVKVAFDSGKLEKGKPADEIMAKYGEPVIILSEDNGKLERWVYKSAKESFFGGERIYLFFDENKKLVEWKIIPKSSS